MAANDWYSIARAKRGLEPNMLIPGSGSLFCMRPSIFVFMPTSQMYACLCGRSELSVGSGLP